MYPPHSLYVEVVATQDVGEIVTPSGAVNISFISKIRNLHCTWRRTAFITFGCPTLSTSSVRVFWKWKRIINFAWIVFSVHSTLHIRSSAIQIKHPYFHLSPLHFTTSYSFISWHERKYAVSFPSDSSQTTNPRMMNINSTMTTRKERRGWI